MKKTLTVIALLAMSLGAFAQNTGKDILKELEEKPLEEKAKKAKPEKEFKVFQMQALARLGYGWHLIDATEFQTGFHKGNAEFFMNITEADFSPAKWLTLSVGMDVKWSHFTPKPEYGFSMVADDLALGAAPAGIDNNQSALSTAAFTFPVGVTLRFGRFASVSAGAEAVVNLPKNSRINDSYAIGSSKYQVKTPAGPAIPGFAWNAFGRVTFGGLFGLYARYYPRQIIPDVPFGCTTVGIIMDFTNF